LVGSANVIKTVIKTTIKTTVCLFATFLLISLLTSPAFAEDQPAASTRAPGCGALGTKFDVKTDKDPHPVQPEAGKALLYFIQDDAAFITRPRPTTRMGVDGAWVGATHSNSYLYVSVNPGVHHLCASWESAEGSGDLEEAAAHFTAEAGGMYYFEAINVYSADASKSVRLNLLDSDEGQLLVDRSSFSASRPKK
jgi:hypothetical protein